MKNNFLRLLLSTILFIPAVVQAQAGGQKAPVKSPVLNQASSGKAASAEPAKATPYCEEALSKLKTTLTSEANKTCATQQTMCECMDRKSGLTIQAMVTVQPSAASCKPLPIPKPDMLPVPLDEMKSGDAIPGKEVKPAPLNPTIMQTTCARSGKSLEVRLFGFDLERCDKDRFAVSWEIDGARVSTSNRVECICGTEATLTIRDLKTRAASVQKIRLNGCTTNSIDGSKQ